MKLFLTILSIIFSSETLSRFVEVDYQSEGDKLLVYDTLTSVEWVKFEAAGNISFQMLSDGYGGFIDAGFSLGNSSSFVGFDSAVAFANQSSLDDALTSGFHEWKAFVELMTGQTLSYPTIPDSILNSPIEEFHLIFDNYAPLGYMTGHLGPYLGHYDGVCSNQADAGYGYYYSTQGYEIGGFSAGTFLCQGSQFNTGNILLVRDVNPVPIPATAWLFGSSLIGLLVARRKS